jgi:hypothetical protein
VPEIRRGSEFVEADLAMWTAVGRVLAITTALFAFGWALRRMRREHAEQLDKLVSLHQQSRSEALELAERVASLATLIAGIPARVERSADAPPAPRRESPSIRSYETARRMARSGASVEEIVATCGLAGAEARLLRQLNDTRPGADLQLQPGQGHETRP